VAASICHLVISSSRIWENDTHPTEEDVSSSGFSITAPYRENSRSLIIPKSTVSFQMVLIAKLSIGCSALLGSTEIENLLFLVKPPFQMYAVCYPFTPLASYWVLRLRGRTATITTISSPVSMRSDFWRVSAIAAALQPIRE
jgi:hypothetical protein